MADLSLMGNSAMEVSLVQTMKRMVWSSMKMMHQSLRTKVQMKRKVAGVVLVQVKVTEMLRSLRVHCACKFRRLVLHLSPFAHLHTP